MMPAAAGARSVAEKLGIRSVSVTFQQLTLPSPHHPPLAYPGRPFPPEVTDNRVLWDLDAQSINAARSCCSTRSAEKGRQCPREPHGIIEPGKVPGAGLIAVVFMLSTASTARSARASASPVTGSP